MPNMHANTDSDLLARADAYTRYFRAVNMMRADFRTAGARAAAQRELTAAKAALATLR